MAGEQIVSELKDTKDSIGCMDVICDYFQAMKWKKEPHSLCFINSKVKLPRIQDH